MSEQKEDAQVERKPIRLNDIITLLDKLKENSVESSVVSYNEDYIEQLKNAYNQFRKNSKFEVGQLVKWKKNLKNRKIPKEIQPAIVLEVLEKTILNQEVEIGSAYFREQIDLVLGVLDESGNMFAFHYDSRRFEPFESE